MSSRNRVFLGKLPADARIKEVERWLHDYGFRHCSNIQLKRGYAFVDFRDSRDAEDCVRDLDRRDFLGSRITVELAHGQRRDRRERDRSRSRERERDRDRDRDRDNGRSFNSSRGSRSSYQNGYYRDRYGAPYNTEWRLMVENLSSRVGWQEMKDFFRQAGTVTYAECHRQKSGTGAVEFAAREDLKRAIDKLDGTEFMGRKLKLIDVLKRLNNKSSSTMRESQRSPREFDRRQRSRSYSRERSRTESDN